MITKSITISWTVSIGIGLHDLGEGLTVGATVLLNQIAFSVLLIIGFELHNTTKGLAIVDPIAKAGKVKI